MPNVENKMLEEKRESFLKYIAAKTIVYAKNLELTKDRLDKLFNKSQEVFKNLSGEIKHLNQNYFVMAI